MSITFEKKGRRVYVRGNTFSLKAQIKAAGGHWDVNEGAWWVGAEKQDELTAAVNRAVQQNASRPEVEDSTPVKGKVEYKGKNYFMVAEARDGRSFKVTTLDMKIVFWAKADNGARIIKRYGRNGRSGYTEYPTIKSLRDFVQRGGSSRQNRMVGDDDRGWARTGCSTCRNLQDWCPQCAFDEFDN